MWDGADRAAARLLVGKLLILRLTTRGLYRPRLRSAGTARISIRMISVMRARWRGGKRGVEGQMAPDDPHGVDEGQRVQIGRASCRERVRVRAVGGGCT